ncbi:hypothetical protein HGRIS_000103 [Hohenbuehelia grisea]|uniref:Aminoglycoside phosphotransferase domain-containing protein n=1 Tax=Hohenbuehelia grisea TaxID=104357 RepID=A0ABR3JR04_9AGAR
MDSTLANLSDYDSDDDSDYQPSICSDDEPDECAEEVSDDEEEDPLNGESYRERTAHLRERLDTDILVHVAHKNPCRGLTDSPSEEQCIILVFNLPTVPVSVSLRSPLPSLRLRFSYSHFVALSPHQCSRRALSIMANTSKDLFNYTSGRWIVNDALRLAERRRIFNVEGLRKLAAESVNRSPDDIECLEKLAEGGFNRIFLITMRDGFRMVARIPYPHTTPTYLAVASEVATLVYLRAAGLPTPEVYGYSPSANNAAETEYIFMEFIQGTNLGDIWFDLGEEEIIPILHQIVDIESKMMQQSFPAGGSLYFTEDLAKAAPTSDTPARPGVTLKDGRFSVGPETSLALWYGRRSLLGVNRGPYTNAEAALTTGAEKELAYLRRFGRPLLPFQRERRDAYGYQEQQPSDHIQNLDRYLRIVSMLTPRRSAVDYFCLRHPDLQPGNVIVSRSPDSNSYLVVGLIDWQHSSILPLSLHAGIPRELQNYGDSAWSLMTEPSLPEKFDDLDDSQRQREMELYRRRVVHYHYVKHTNENNILHYAFLMDHIGMLRRRLFNLARAPWEGETHALKVALIEATKNWESVAGEGIPCPIAFDQDDVRKTMELDVKLREMDECIEEFRDAIGVGPEDWVPAEHYEEALARSAHIQEHGLAEIEDEEERAMVAAHWAFDDMDEEPYM